MVVYCASLYAGFFSIKNKNNKQVRQTNKTIDRSQTNNPRANTPKKQASKQKKQQKKNKKKNTHTHTNKPTNKKNPKNKAKNKTKQIKKTHTNKDANRQKRSSVLFLIFPPFRWSLASVSGGCCLHFTL